jgi:hypothetical protein
MYEMFIEGNVPSSKNSKRIVRNPATGVPFLIDSENAAKYKKVNSIYYLAHKAGFNAFMKDTDQPIRLIMYFVRDSKRRFDYHNASQIITDVMVKLGMLPDDDADTVIPVYAGYEVNPDKAGVFLYALPDALNHHDIIEFRSYFSKKLSDIKAA